MSQSAKSSRSKKAEECSETLPLEDMTVNQLKALLKEKGLPRYGRKAELVERLRDLPTGPKPKPWQYSQAKKDLKRALLDPTSPIHNMSIEAICDSDKRYKQYPNFKQYYKDLKEKVEAEKIQVKDDDSAAKRYLENFPTPYLNERGYPNWRGHPAKALLEVDVANELHKKMKPQELCATQNEYKEFPVNVFGKRVQKEADKQRTATFWADKRNKEGMKRYLKEIKRRAAENL